MIACESSTVINSLPTFGLNASVAIGCFDQLYTYNVVCLIKNHHCPLDINSMHLTGL